jgi:hypothetical protein
MPSLQGHHVITRKSTGVGSDLISIAGACWYAQRTSRHVLVDWRGSRYSQDIGSNLFPELFVVEQESGQPEITPVQRDFSDTSLLGPILYSNSQNFEEYHHEMLIPAMPNNCDFVCTRPMHHLPSESEQCKVLSRIKPVSSIHDKIEQFVDSHFRGRSIIGIHIRYGNGELLGDGRDELFKQGLNFLLQRCENALTSLSGSADAIFLCTDSALIRDAITSRFKNVFSYPSKVGTHGPIHVRERGIPGAVEAVIEMWLLAECKGLIFNPSWFSHYARVVGNFSMGIANLSPQSLYGTMDLYNARIKSPHV